MTYEETDEYLEWQAALGLLGNHLPERNRLLPGETYLTFNEPYIQACAATPPEMNSLGFYSAGWEL